MCDFDDGYDSVSEDSGADIETLDIDSEVVDINSGSGAGSEDLFDDLSLDELDDGCYHADRLSEDEVQQINDLWNEENKSADVEPYQAERMNEAEGVQSEELNSDKLLDAEPYHAVLNDIDTVSEDDSDNVTAEMETLSLDELEAVPENIDKFDNEAGMDIFKEHADDGKGSLTEEQYHDLVDDLPKEALEYLRDGLENHDKDVLDYFGLSSENDSSDHPKELILKRR